MLSGPSSAARGGAGGWNVGTIYANIEARANKFLATVSSMTQKINEFEKSMKRLTLIGTGMAAAAGAFVVSGVKINAQIEKLRISYKVLLKDQEQANAAFDYLHKLADKSPFQTVEILEAGKMMMSFGLDLKEYMADAMNMSSAMGASLMEVVGALGRVKSGAFGEAMERLRYLGISREMLEGQGLEFDRNGSFRGSVDEVLAGVVGVIRQRFGGMIEEQAQTWQGMTTTLISKLKWMNMEATESMFSSFKGPLENMIKALDKLGPAGNVAAGGIIKLVGALGVLIALGSAITIWQAKVTAALSAIGGSLVTLFTNPIFLAIAAATALTIGIVTLTEAKKKYVDSAIKVYETQKDEANAHKTLLDDYKKIKAQVDGAKVGSQEYHEAQRRLYAKMAEIEEVYPSVVTAHNQIGEARKIDIGLLEEQIKKEKELESRRRAEAQGALIRSINERKQELANLEAMMKSNQEQLKGAEGEDRGILGGLLKWLRTNKVENASEGIQKLKEEIIELEAKLKAITVVVPDLDTALEDLGDTAGEGTGGGVDLLAEALERLRSSMEGLIGDTLEFQMMKLNLDYEYYKSLGIQEFDLYGMKISLHEWYLKSKEALDLKYYKMSQEWWIELYQSEFEAMLPSNQSGGYSKRLTGSGSQITEDIEGPGSSNILNNPALEEYIRNLGLEAEKITKEDIARIIKEFLEELDKRNEEAYQDTLRQVTSQSNAEVAGIMAQIHTEFVNLQLPEKSFWDKMLDIAGAIGKNLLEDIKQVNSAIGSFTQAYEETGSVEMAIAAAIADLLAQTESFGKFLDLLSKPFKLIVKHMDSLLGVWMPIIEAVIKALTFVLGLISNVVIFLYNITLGWLLGKADYVDLEEVWNDQKKESGGKAGHNISEITGPTRDLLERLLTPLADLPNGIYGTFDRLDLIIRHLETLIDIFDTSGKSGDRVLVGSVSVSVDGNKGDILPQLYEELSGRGLA